MYIERLKDKMVFRVQKYILDKEGVESVWVDKWIGRHVIGQDCRFVNMVRVDADKALLWWNDLIFQEQLYYANEDRQDKSVKHPDNLNKEEIKEIYNKYKNHGNREQ